MATQSSVIAWKNPVDRGNWQATVHGVAESDKTESEITENLCTYNIIYIYYIILYKYYINYI